MITTDRQVIKLMEELGKGNNLEKSGLRAGISRNTASKYARAGKLPSELKVGRDWKTREDPFGEDWPQLEAMLVAAPELEAKTLFEYLVGLRPETYEEGQLRTLQRHVHRWRAMSGPPKEVFFAQEHRPGEAMQTDFTWVTELEITIQGEAFSHMLCHPVLPYSNWEWATVCHSESMMALRRGIQAALFQLGRVPEWMQTDHSTAATHNLGDGNRPFNAEYKALVAHFGMKPRTTEVGEKEQNGDVEALNGALKRRLKQHLLLRGSRDFASVEAWESFLWGVLETANRLRHRRLQDELSVMAPLQAGRLPEYTVVEVPVHSWSTIAVKRNIYSVPSRLIRERVRVHVYDDRIEVFFAGELQLTVERLRGEGGHRINYRHVAHSLACKPGAFARYKYREELFPTMAFRRAYDALTAALPGYRADGDYVRILHLAAVTMETEVEAALTLLMDQDQLPRADAVKALVAPAAAEVPQITMPEVDLAAYDGLLTLMGEAA